MGKHDGKYLRGTVGNHVYRKDPYGKGVIIQMRPVVVNQTKNTKKAAGIMGTASSFSKQVRGTMQILTGNFYSGDMVNRFTALNREIFEHCCNKETDTYRFEPDSFHKMQGLNSTQTPYYPLIFGYSRSWN